jgi:hypothetical protein
LPEAKLDTVLGIPDEMPKHKIKKTITKETKLTKIA